MFSVNFERHLQSKTGLLEVMVCGPGDGEGVEGGEVRGALGRNSACEMRSMAS